jgi:hypothetical protein
MSIMLLSVPLRCQDDNESNRAVETSTVSVKYALDGRYVLASLELACLFSDAVSLNGLYIRDLHLRRL